MSASSPFSDDQHIRSTNGTDIETERVRGAIRLQLAQANIAERTELLTPAAAIALGERLIRLATNV